MVMQYFAINVFSKRGRGPKLFYGKSTPPTVVYLDWANNSHGTTQHDKITEIYRGLNDLSLSLSLFLLIYYLTGPFAISVPSEKI